MPKTPVGEIGIWMPKSPTGEIGIQMPKSPIGEIGIWMPKTPIGEFGIRMLNLGSFPHKIPPCYMEGILRPHTKFPQSNMKY